MGVYEQGTSNAPPEQPALGHPVYPPVVYKHASYDQGMRSPAPMLRVHPEVLNTEEWATKMCGSCNDCDICCQTCWCPCVTFGQVAAIVDEGQTSCGTQGAIYGLLCSLGIPCVYSFMWRKRLRQKFRLKKGPCGDFCAHCCCSACALCQEHRELQSRGLDPSLGWEVARHYAVPQQQQQQPMTVPSPDVMRR